MIAAGILSLALATAATYTDSLGTKWCVRISSTQPHVAGEIWAWASVNADPRRVIHAPLKDFAPGCQQGAINA